MLPVSVIIPALNEAQALPETLARLRALAPGPAEILVADGGSTDRTAEIAESFGAKLVRGVRGRGPQQHAGALAASGAVLWFLHADTHPEPGALAAIDQALRDPVVIGGHFRLRFTGTSFAARFVTSYQPILRRLKLVYGDSAIFVRRETYERAGGFSAIPLFDDLDLTRRLRKLGRFVTVPSEVITSSRRFEGRLARTFSQWMLLQALYDAGVAPERLARLYRHLR